MSNIFLFIFNIFISYRYNGKEMVANVEFAAMLGTYHLLGQMKLEASMAEE